MITDRLASPYVTLRINPVGQFTNKRLASDTVHVSELAVLRITYHDLDLPSLYSAYSSLPHLTSRCNIPPTVCHLLETAKMMNWAKQQ